MKIAIAQTRPIAGEVPRNLVVHQRLIQSAIDEKVGLILFPELSITGYEPTLANNLAMNVDDGRLDCLQKLSDQNQLTITVGAPTRHQNGTCISLIMFQPARSRQSYSKIHLHPDEEPFFVPGERSTGLIRAEKVIALAICYEISVAEHAENARRNGAEIYLASVAKSDAGIEKAQSRLGEVARQYSMLTMMANCVGTCDGWKCAGRSSVWNTNGELLAQLDDESEGILLIDTATNETRQRLLR